MTRSLSDYRYPLFAIGVFLMLSQTVVRTQLLVTEVVILIGFIFMIAAVVIRIREGRGGG